MDLIAKILKIISPKNADPGAPTYMNIVMYLIAAAALVVTLACKLSLPVPGINCETAVVEETGT